MSEASPHTLRLILGDQLNHQHSWFSKVEANVIYILMEVRTETDYATHHIQKVVAFFSAMRQFADELRGLGHQVLYITLDQDDNLQSFSENLEFIIKKHCIQHFEYQLPDEYRVDKILSAFVKTLEISSKVFDSEHFLANRQELATFFKGKKTFLMESFYRHMRKKYHVLMDGDQPLTGQWNYDGDNRQKLPQYHKPTPPLMFDNDVEGIVEIIKSCGIKTIGNINPSNFIWPINRTQSIQLLDYFIQEFLPRFGTFQDAMSPTEWSLYHSRISFSMNVKMIAPLEVIQAAIQAWQTRPDEISYNQLEGFVRQIIGWREYMRGIYWLKMPEYADLNYFDHQQSLPSWFWTGKTKMNCLKHAIGQSLEYAYAHHIQRLMITGNFALLASIHPDEVDAWYLGIYIDAIEWVEITNTRGMSQFADGGIVGTKPYVSSSAYIDKMGHYCGTCYYNKTKKVGDKACPFNSLYWNFYKNHEEKLSKNPRIAMMYNIWRKMKSEDQSSILTQARAYLAQIEDL